MFTVEQINFGLKSPSADSVKVGSLVHARVAAAAARLAVGVVRQEHTRTAVRAGRSTHQLAVLDLVLRML